MSSQISPRGLLATHKQCMSRVLHIVLDDVLVKELNELIRDLAYHPPVIIEAIQRSHRSDIEVKVYAYGITCFNATWSSIGKGAHPFTIAGDCEWIMDRMNDPKKVSECPFALVNDQSNHTTHAPLTIGAYQYEAQAIRSSVRITGMAWSVNEVSRVEATFQLPHCNDVEQYVSLVVPSNDPKMTPHRLVLGIVDSWHLITIVQTDLDEAGRISNNSASKTIDSKPIVTFERLFEMQYAPGKISYFSLHHDGTRLYMAYATTPPPSSFTFSHLSYYADGKWYQCRETGAIRSKGLWCVVTYQP